MRVLASRIGITCAILIGLPAISQAVVFDLDVAANCCNHWVDTGLAFEPGTELCLVGEGSWDIINGYVYCEPFGPGGLCACEAPPENCLASGQGQDYPGPELSAWGLIGRVGDCEPFMIDGVVSHEVVCGGNLFVAINDNWWADNTGWAQVTIELCANANDATTWGRVKSLFR